MRQIDVEKELLSANLECSGDGVPEKRTRLVFPSSVGRQVKESRIVKRKN